ncbi:nitroreductase family protein [Halanaerobium hydrogeniformans]|uniref:Nitroreductase family protein n=1 Tax=Halanaerobium hydrogeniformans TaxID=656519 RepID=E4RM86_HALHG|nr:nitroreductase family protein [Halanaerobium hydrogeniformans]ADQ14417.1 nitroreductase family protein [Halanaerobium hydrogeniformans]
MHIPVKEWYNAVQTRYSHQKFSTKNIKAYTQKTLENTIYSLNQVYPEVRLELYKSSIQDILPALNGKYGNFTDSPAFLAIIIKDEGKHRWTKAGYIGEAAILEATADGLGTCWIGANFVQRKSLININLQPGEQLIAVSPLGYSSEGYSFTRHFISKLFPNRDRKDLELLCPNGYNDEWPGWVKNAIQTARAAPSRLNRQPWRFYYGDDRIVVDCAGEPSEYKRLECGIALLHIQIGAMDGGAEGNIEFGEVGLASFVKKHY